MNECMHADTLYEEAEHNRSAKVLLRLATPFPTFPLNANSIDVTSLLAGWSWSWTPDAYARPSALPREVPARAVQGGGPALNLPTGRKTAAQCYQLDPNAICPALRICRKLNSQVCRHLHVSQHRPSYSVSQDLYHIAHQRFLMRGDSFKDMSHM